MANQIPAPSVPLIDGRGFITPAWYQYFVRREVATDQAQQGEVVAGSGLSGGGFVVDGVTLSIAEHGVDNAQLRQAAPTSIIGNASSDAGDVADIAATSDHEVLSREAGELAFRNTLDGITLGATTAASAKFTSIALTGTPTSSSASTTHKIAITCAGTNYFILLSDS